MVTDVSVSSDHPNPAAVRRLVSPRTVGLLLFGSATWITVCLAVWLAPIIFTGGFGLITVPWLGLGAPFGVIAASSVSASLWLVQRVFPPAVAVVVASIIGWSATLGIWWLIGFGWTANAMFVSIAVSSVGAVIAMFTCWPRRPAVRMAGIHGQGVTSGNAAKAEDKK